MDALTMLLHIDATLSWPPYTTWMKAPEAIRAWLLGPGVGCRGSKLIRTVASGSPSAGQYRPSTSGHGYEPWRCRSGTRQSQSAQAIQRCVETTIITAEAKDSSSQPSAKSSREYLSSSACKSGAPGGRWTITGPDTET